MRYKKPCFVTRVDTFLAKDEIRPYGERFHVSSEKRRKEVALQLLSEADTSKEKDNN